VSILPSNIPLEFQILLSACRVFLGTEEPSQLVQYLLKGPEWDLLLALANRHRVMPLLYRSISQNCQYAVPHEWLALLKRQYLMNAALNMKMAAELLRILQALKDAGIRAVPLKGPVLAQQVYGDIALRQFSDLDIFVAPNDVYRALDVVLCMGYKLDNEISASKRRALMETAHHYHLINSRSAIIIELHWAIAPGYYGLKMDADQILDRVEPTILMDKQIAGVSNDDTIVLISKHGTKHVWSRLSWICDMAGLVFGKGPALLHLNQMMTAEGEERTFLLGLLLAKDLLGSEVPPDIALLIRGDRVLIDLSCKIVQLLISDLSRTENMETDQMHQSILYMNICRSPSQKIYYFLRMISDPSDVDMNAITLPNSLVPLYRLVKILRMIKTYMRPYCEWWQRSIRQ
jgi:hypothetical protein